MRLKLEGVARVDVRSRLMVAALEHEVTFSAPLAPLTVDVTDETAIDAPVAARFAVAKLEPPATASRADRAQMTDKLMATLDAARFPELAFQGSYRGSTSAGRLEGELTVRGVARRVVLDVRGDGSRATATWVGTLSELGIKPPKLLLGTIRLADWARIRLEVTLTWS